MPEFSLKGIVTTPVIDLLPFPFLFEMKDKGIEGIDDL